MFAIATNCTTRCKRWSLFRKKIGDPEWQEAVESWMPLLADLMEGWRVLRAQVNERRYIVASERAKDFALIFPEAKFEVVPPELPPIDGLA